MDNGSRSCRSADHVGCAIRTSDATRRWHLALQRPRAKAAPTVIPTRAASEALAIGEPRSLSLSARPPSRNSWSVAARTGLLRAVCRKVPRGGRADVPGPSHSLLAVHSQPQSGQAAALAAARRLFPREPAVRSTALSGTAPGASFRRGRSSIDLALPRVQSKRSRRERASTHTESSTCTKLDPRPNCTATHRDESTIEPKPSNCF